MIIVSQDRRRITENLEICVYKGDNGKFVIENEFMLLGEYETEERAKEVLEKIIYFYSGIDIYSDNDMPLENKKVSIEARKIGVFYMPEK